MLSYEDIRMVHFEPTQQCQASCPMCDRNMNGGDVNPYLKNATLTLEDTKKLFPKEFVQQLNYLYMCGNHGDPILAPDAADMMEYFRECNPYIKLSMTTNGGARKADFWEKLAANNVGVNFSVDGLEDTNHLYRQGVVWKNVEYSIDAFTSAGGNADWTFLVFNYNEHQVEEAERYSKLLGVNNFIVKKSGRYLTADNKRKEAHQAVFRGDLATLLSQPKKEKYKNKELQKDFDLNKIYESKIHPKCVEKKEIYVSAEGFVFPCCWTQGQMYKWYLPKESAEIWKHIKKHEIDAKKTSIKYVVEGGFFKSISNTWNSENKLKVCSMKCNKVWNPYEAQWS